MKKVQVEHNGNVVIGTVVSAWKAMPDKIGIVLAGFDYSKSNFQMHILDKKDIVKYLTK